MGTVPAARVGVPPLVLEAHGDAVPREAPQLLHETVVELLLRTVQEDLDGLSTAWELIPIAPSRVLSIGEGDPPDIEGVQPVLF